VKGECLRDIDLTKKHNFLLLSGGLFSLFSPPVKAGGNSIVLSKRKPIGIKSDFFKSYALKFHLQFTYQLP
jgi:hypothetical protein